jgi:transposase InsO family protein
MRENDLLAPSRAGNAHGPKAHDGTIIPPLPDEMWGTDATSTLTGEGYATVFLLVDHATAECVGLHAARNGTRFEALEPLRQATRELRGGFEEGALRGVTLRHDHGSQFTSHVYQTEIRFLGMVSSPAYVGEPEGNGCSERFVRTLKEQLLWLHRFATVEELNRALHAFREKYNREWLIERHGWVSPSEQRRRLLGEEEAA